MSASPVSSNPILRVTLFAGGAVGLVVIVLATLIGWWAAGGEGAASGAIGAAVGMIFPALTAVSILVANRWFGSPAYLQIFFGVVLGGWLVKFILVIVAFLVLAQVEWLVDIVFYLSLVVAAVASLVVDLVVMSRMRLPGVSDITLPGE